MLGKIIMGKQTIRICVILSSIFYNATGNDVPTNLHTFKVLKRALKAGILERQVLEERHADADREYATSIEAVKRVEKEFEFRLPKHNYDVVPASIVVKGPVKKAGTIVWEFTKASLNVENVTTHSANQIYKREQLDYSTKSWDDLSESSCHVKGHCETQEDSLNPCSVIVSRADWSARNTRGASYMNTPVSIVFIHHTAMRRCNHSETCILEVKKIQDLHMDTNGWVDIGYSFVVGDDGKAYEARGWDRNGAHTRGWNDKSIAIAVMGNFNYDSPSEFALEAINSLIGCGISEGNVTPDYVLYGHRDASQNFDSPGHAFYELIQEWSHFSVLNA